MRKLSLNFYATAAPKKSVRKYLPHEPSIGRSFGRQDYTEKLTELFSPMTGCTYLVNTVYSHKGNFRGYQIEFDVGDCAVASPFICHNNMSLAVKVGEVLLQNFLAHLHVPKQVHSYFSTEHSRIDRATSGFYVPVQTVDEARRLVSSMTERLDGLHNYRSTWDCNYHDRLQYHGSPRNGHWTLQGKHHSLKLFEVMDPMYWQQQNVFAWSDTGLPADFLIYCQQFVYIELTVSTNWLQHHDLSHPNAWETDAGYQKMLALVFKDFDLTQPLTIGYPGPATVAELYADNPALLSDDQSTLLSAYFDGKDIRGEALVLENAHPKRAYKNVRKQIKKSLGIDIAIPWETLTLVNATTTDARRFSSMATSFELATEHERYVFGTPNQQLVLPSIETMQHTWSNT